MSLAFALMRYSVLHISAFPPIPLAPVVPPYAPIGPGTPSMPVLPLLVSPPHPPFTPTAVCDTGNSESSYAKTCMSNEGRWYAVTSFTDVPTLSELNDDDAWDGKFEGI